METLCNITPCRIFLSKKEISINNNNKNNNNKYFIYIARKGQLKQYK